MQIQTDLLKTILTLGLKATGEITNRLIEFLPEEPGQKVKSAGMSVLKVVYDVTGEWVRSNECGGEPVKTGPSKIIIE